MEIKYKFGKVQEIEIENGVKVEAYHHDKFSQDSAFEPGKKIIVITMAIFGKRNNKIVKIAWFASFDKGKSFEFLRTVKA